MNYNGTGASVLETYHMLELIGVSHTGPIVPENKATCWSKMTGSITSGLILKDVSFEVHSGEVMAILGSKGSGKRALIDVIAHRISEQGSTKGQILLNDVPLTLRLFQEQCGFVSKRTQLIYGLTVRQMLYYMSQMTLKTNSSIKRNRIKQVLADLALSQLSNRKVSELSCSEIKRLAIGLQLIRDPLLLVLDDPTANLDPLNTYFVISILSNHAKKYGRIIILTMDKPRSDIFPFLDRVTYLCLGDVVYTGSTRMMMDYFRGIGFPCPELENPLMYYLCLSTVDRRSRDRFIESSAQIAALVDKFKVEGHEYRKHIPQMANNNGTMGNTSPTIPLTAYGRASSFTVTLALLGRQFNSMFTWWNLFLRLLVLPLFCALLYLFILPRLGYQQQTFQSRSGIIFNAMASVTFIAPSITAYYFATHRNCFYEESSRMSLYRGPLFIFTNILTSIPFNLLTVWMGASIVYWAAGLRADEWWLERWAIFCATLWAVFTFAEQHTIAIMCFIKSPFIATITSIYFLNFYLILGCGTFRSMLAAPDWLNYINYANIYHYASWTLNFNEFQNNPQMDRTPALAEDLSTVLPCPVNVLPGRCLFINGTHFLVQRFKEITDAGKSQLPAWSVITLRNFVANFVFAFSAYAFSTIVFVIPLPGSLKAKFRD
ncbi:ABC transporter sub-family G-like protein 12 [Dinothrombium tinctorium]|uniref:ABC transporter sub-family G-like protein 12 n=1 Tax=Dinothrombium tinctorium TaxID=1965070 RepID=A0A3S4RFH2_9ACAR|nr:ABC transporter sub-family G-like protein 12 [Dinothrombium tinctorium]